MTTISQLTRVTAVASADVLPVASAADGETMGASVSQLQTYMQDNLDFTGGVMSLRNFTPLAGDTCAISSTAQQSIWVALAPSGTLATLTIAFTGTPQNLQEIMVSTSTAITALTFTTPQAQQGAASSMSANGFFKMKYDGVNSIWRRVG